MMILSEIRVIPWAGNFSFTKVTAIAFGYSEVVFSRFSFIVFVTGGVNINGSGFG